jgi:hypothetical protein
MKQIKGAHNNTIKPVTTWDMNIKNNVPIMESMDII